ncbi:MAG: hypothetical protein WCX31_16185 [Salinivirgaceae bacterium]
MRYSIFSLTAFLVLFSFCGFTQNVENNGAKSKAVPSEYDRNAITVILLDNSTQHMQDLKNAASGIVVPSKFDDNLIETRILIADTNAKDISKALVQYGIPNKILAKWFSRKENGEFDMSVIHERGMYNATDDEVVRASASKIGLAKLKDAGESLINHSYILVLEFKNVEDAQKKVDAGVYYKKKGGVFVLLKDRNGWVSDVKAYLYKMTFNDSVMNVFYNDLWIYDDDSPELKATKKAKFEQTQFPLTFMTKLNTLADGTQPNSNVFGAPLMQLTRDELFQKMINTGLSNIIFEVERKKEEFRVKTPLYGTSPLKAKIGKKEGLYSEQRFFVLEFQQNRKGETVAKRKGVVRTQKAIDNREVATGQSDKFTTFYQTAGLSLMEGMLLQQRNDFGFGISGGYTLLGEMGGVYLKVEVNVGAMVGRFIDLRLTQVKVFGTVNEEFKEHASPLLGADPYDMNFTRWQVGVSKGWYFARNFSIAPFAAYGSETAKGQDWIDANPTTLTDSASISTSIINIGAYASMNVTHWMQLVGGVNYYIPFGKAFDQKQKGNLGNYYTDYFIDRKGMSIDVGLRVEF